jgi:glycine/D-amino acid oxidase-like deaminating enzyme
MENDVKVAIIGGGFAGISTAYQLAKIGVESLIIEAGKIAEGNDEFPAGTLSIQKPDFSKWITHAFDSNYSTFTKIHGKDKAKTFLELTQIGTELIRETIQNKKSEIKRELGSIVIGENIEEWDKLQNEHENYLDLEFGMNYRQMSKSDLDRKLEFESKFAGGLYIPSGFMINQREYVKLLLELSKPSIEICEKAKVTKLEETGDGVKISTELCGEITADQVIVATNGFYEDSNLKDLLFPHFTFMRSYESPGKNTPGCWTFGEKYYYFTRQDNLLIIGGEDLPIKDNKEFRIDETQGMNKLQNWAESNFEEAKNKNLIATHFGVYARTKDELPIVGKFKDKSRINYIVGCNAIGHTTYNVAANIMPHLLGYTQLTKEQKKFANFLSPQRETLK